MRFELSNEDYQRLFGDRQQQIELLEYSYQMLEDALRELANDKDMITKEEIKDHLAHTVYSSGARKSIRGFLIGVGIDADDIEFANRNCSAREENAKTFEDFLKFIDKPAKKADLEEFLIAIGINPKTFEPLKSDDFQIGDWVKYIPEPGEESTECIEAIAHGTDGAMYFCLSNGEYVRPCYCVKYKVQGEERRKLIDKLNEVL